MSKDAAEIHVASDGEVLAAPVGTAMPTSPTGSPNAAFINLGFLNEDGVTFTDTPSVEDIRAWQAADPVRRLVTERVLTVAGSLLQVNQENFLVAFGGGSWESPSAGVYKYTPPAAQDALAETAMIVRSHDGTKNNEYNVFRGNITEAVESQLQRTGPQLLPFTLSALTPTGGGAAWEFLTDDAYAFGFLS
jgi:hypothetical protein